MHATSNNTLSHSLTQSLARSLNAGLKETNDALKAFENLDTTII
jgi:hypothetical protein